MICLDCDESYLDYRLSFDEHILGKSNVHIPAKVSLNPNEAGLMLIHFALQVDVSKVRLDSRIAYLCHFENYYTRRVSKDAPQFHKFELPHHLPCNKSNESWLSQQIIEKGNIITSFYFQFEVVILAALLLFLIVLAITYVLKCLSRRRQLFRQGV